MILEFINVVEAFAEFDGLLHGDSAVYGSLNLFNRVLASSIHERGNVEVFSGMGEDVLCNGACGLTKDIGEHIIQFEVGDGEAVCARFSPARQLVSLTR